MTRSCVQFGKLRILGCHMHHFLSPSELGFGRRARPRIGHWPRSEDAWLLVYLFLQITRCGRIHLPKKVANLWIAKCQSYLWAEVLAALLLAFIKLCMNMIRPSEFFFVGPFSRKKVCFHLLSLYDRNDVQLDSLSLFPNWLPKNPLWCFGFDILEVSSQCFGWNWQGWNFGEFVSVDTSSTFNEARHAHLKEARTRWARSIVFLGTCGKPCNRCHLWW